jgi:beta-1,4-mannooligosaccharide/beta-1,4-mannosyl-N-acetylglucosamine phosphorylase
MLKIIGEKAIPNMPWEDKPAGCKEVLWRFSGNPIFDWNPGPKAARIYNSAVVTYGDAFVGVFRADHKDMSMNIHFGKSKDAVNWEIEDEPIQWLDESGNPFQPGYAYDPRVCKIEDEYYIMWCTKFGNAPTIGLGKTKDFKTFTRLENAYLPYNRNGVLFPRKINGKYVMLSRPSDNGHTAFGDIFVSESPDMVHWGRHRSVMGKSDGWQSLKIGAGPIPIETSEGWLMIYHGVIQTCNGYVYSIGSALLDINEPSKVLARSNQYLLTPEAEYETCGFVPNVAFPCAALVDAPTGRIALYYGCADTYTGIAFGKVDEIVEWTKKNSKLGWGDDDIGRN